MTRSGPLLEPVDKRYIETRTSTNGTAAPTVLTKLFSCNTEVRAVRNQKREIERRMAPPMNRLVALAVSNLYPSIAANSFRKELRRGFLTASFQYARILGPVAMASLRQPIVSVLGHV